MDCGQGRKLSPARAGKRAKIEKWGGFKKSHDQACIVAIYTNITSIMTSVLNVYRHGFVLLTCLFLCQCSTIDPARKAAIKKVVVATNVGNEITRYKVGLMAFGNDWLDPIRDARLKPEVERILREETQGKFPNVVFSKEEPPLTSKNVFTPTDYRPFARQLAQKHGADAVLLITGRYYYPYAAPSYMTAQGMGIWHVGNMAQVQCYVNSSLMDAQGVNLGRFGRFGSGQQLPGLEFKEKFSDYSPADQERIMERCLDEFRVEVSSYLKGIGF